MFASFVPTMRVFTQQDIRRNGDGTAPRNAIFQRLHNIFGPFLPILTYIAIMLMLILIGSLPPIINVKGSKNDADHLLIPGNSTDGGPSENTRTNSTLGNLTDVNPNIDAGPQADLSWLFPTILSVLFLYCMFVMIRIMRSLALSRQEAMGPPNDASMNRLNNFLAQIARNGSRENWRSRLRLALVNRDFTGEDYEMLRQLDEVDEINLPASRRRGATQSAISRLPIHIMTQTDLISDGDEVARKCPICLEPYVVGDNLKTTVCLHQFHEHCIDPWLRNNGTCPVCKSGATE